jgi:hypothetical protein
MNSRTIVEVFSKFSISTDMHGEINMNHLWDCGDYTSAAGKNPHSSK